MPTPLYLPYKFTSVSIDAGNVNPFGIDPEQTASLDTGNADPSFIDPEQTTLTTVGLTPED